MKHKFILFFFFTILFSGYSVRVDAQFWKKLFGREEKLPPRKKPSPPKPENNTNPVVKKNKKHSIGFPESIIKKRYRIDVVVPLYINELVKDDRVTFKGRIPEKAVNGLDFYEGLKLAADTLNAYGYKIDVYVHDITNAGNSPESLVEKHILDSSDLIIGAIPSQYIMPFALFAKEHKINFISALSPSDGEVKDNQYFILLQPTFDLHCEQLVKIISKKYPKQKPVLLYRTSVNMDDIAYSYFSDVDVRKAVLCDSINALEELEIVFDSTETNLVLMPILDVSYAEKLIKRIYELFPGYRIDIYGMPSWESMHILNKPDLYPNVAVYFTSPFFFDASTASGQAVARSFKKATGGNKPSEMVFRGYETMYWYTYLLTRYGTIFNEKLADNGAAPFTRFNITPVFDDDNNIQYFKNKHLNLYRYQGGDYMVESE